MPSPLRVVEHPKEAWCDAEHAENESPAAMTEEMESPSILDIGVAEQAEHVPYLDDDDAAGRSTPHNKQQNTAMRRTHVWRYKKKAGAT